jgi:thiamine biosynthesis lipoprotein ApbE
MALCRVEPVMGTVVSFDLRDDVVPTGAVEGAIAWLHEVDERFSPFRPDSEVSRLADGTLAEAEAHPDVRAVLAMCDELRRDSGGAPSPACTPSRSTPAVTSSLVVGRHPVPPGASGSAIPSGAIG